MMMETTTRPDISCPKSGELIPLHSFSISKFSDKLYYVYCPECGVFHPFTPTHATTEAEEKG
jgi:hypothetical protein